MSDDDFLYFDRIESNRALCLVPPYEASHSNTGRGRERGGWRGQSDNTNCRTSGLNSRDNRRNFNQESGKKKVITVPSDKVGRIIGKGGCKIRDLEFKSEAKIKIGNSSGNETTVTLFGSTEATLKVEGMINELIKLAELKDIRAGHINFDEEGVIKRRMFFINRKNNN